MAIINEKKERRLIPNWRDFSTTISLGELDASSITPIIKPNLSIDDYVEDFRENETIPFAADLLSAAIVNGFTDSIEVKNAAKFIFDRQNQATQSQVDISQNILLIKDNNLECEIERITIRQLAQCLPEQEYRDKIKQLKQYVVNFPYNSIAWVELSRCYSILGQEKQAVRAMKIAVQLAPNNRFVLRCAVRLFSHYYELDLAHDILRKNNATNFDPWLMSAEISVANLRGRNSKFIKRGIELIDSKNLSPFSITELASSIGTIDLLSGDRKKSRKMFGKSLVAPNDNSLAQIEWILNTKDKTLIDREQMTFQPKLDFEAQVFSNLYNKKLINALNNACRWFCDMPFSKQPVILGSSIAAVLDNRNLSIDFLKLGLLSHSTDAQMLNNIAYYLSLENNTQDAKKYMERVNWNGLSKLLEVCLTATQGLICFRENRVEEGRQYYLKAIEDASNERDKYNMSIALLNYAREEIIAKTDEVDSVMQAVSNIPKISEDDITLKKLYAEVLELYEKHKSTDR